MVHRGLRGRRGLPCARRGVGRSLMSPGKSRRARPRRKFEPYDRCREIRNCGNAVTTSFCKPKRLGDGPLIDGDKSCTARVLRRIEPA